MSKARSLLYGVVQNTCCNTAKLEYTSNFSTETCVTQWSVLCHYVGTMHVAPELGYGPMWGLTLPRQHKAMRMS